MNEYDSPNYASFTYEIKNEGRVRLFRTLAVLGYILFLVAFFLVCYLTKLIPVFAIAPILLWMIIFFTWRYVSYECYFEFKSGVLELGIVRQSKRGKKSKCLVSIRVKEAISASVYNSQTDDLSSYSKVYNFSASESSDKRIIIVFEKDGNRCAAIFEGTARVANLIASFSPCGKSLKGEMLHG